MLKSLQSRLTASLIGLAIIPLVIVGVIFSIMSYSALRQQALVEQQLKAQQVGTAVESLIHELTNNLILLSKTHDGFIDGTPSEQQWLLDELLAFGNHYQELRLIGPEGDELLARSKGKIILASDLKKRADDPAFQVPFSTNQTYFGPVHLAPDSGAPLMAISVPIQSPLTGKNVGVFLGQTRFKKIWELLSSLPTRKGETIFIVDEKGAIVAHPNPSVVLRNTHFTLPTDLKHFGVGLDNNHVALGIVKINLGEQSLYVVAQRLESEVLALARNTLLLISLLMLVALGIATYLSIRAIAHITRPLRDLAYAAIQIKDGDLTRRVQNGRHDEVGKLATAFNAMTSRLQRSLNDMTQEIEQRKKAEEDRKNLELQLVQAQKMESIGTLAGGIAHDFNNILSIIFGYTEMSMTEEDPQVRQENLNEVYTAATRAKDLVRQILTFSRKTEQEFQPMQVSLLVKEVLKMLRSSIPTTIEMRQNITCRALVMADPTQIHQVVMNLCTNAYQAMKDNGGILAVSLEEVEIGAADYDYIGLSAGKYMKLDVGDTGCGIDPAIREKIFDPYFTTKKQGEGTGMGLAVVHGIVKNHHGHITLYSEPGKGTNFHVYLPIHEQETTASSPLPEATAANIGSGEQILIIDDEEPICAVASAILSQNGYKVTCFTDPEKGLHAFEDQPDKFDLVLTDMTMPHLTGAELAKQLLIIKPKLPIILCTGQSALIDRKKALDIGICDYLNKPYITQDLLAAIAQALHSR